MATLALWLRWSWRDLRERWLQVVAIALIIALSTAVYVGLGSTTPWRKQAAAASYDLLHMYDLRVQLTQGNYIERDAAVDTIFSIPHAGWITGLEPRLIESTFVNVVNGDDDILVRGRIIGVEVSDGEPQVNGVYINTGRALTPADAGELVTILDFHFAEHYSLPPQGQLELSGGVPVDYVGQGMSPEYFMIATEEGGMWAQANFAVLFMPLASAQALTDHPAQVNDLVLTLHDAADIDTVRAEIEAAFQTDFPTVGITFKTRDDDSIYRILLQSIDMNQQIYDIIIVLFMAGAMFGAFNLASRIVEAQRRQIGIGMALGLPPRVLVIRPLLVGGQIAILGAIFGVILGLGIGTWAEGWIKRLIPMPVSGDLFQPDIFLEAVVIGLVLPLIATIYPVWRAVRVQPVDAIRTGHLVSKGGGLTPGVNRFPIPGRSFTQMPVRNLLRSPRRTILTVLGIGAAITTLVGLTGILDGALLVMDRSNAEAVQDHPERLLVFLNSFYAVDSPQITAITASPTLAMATPAIRIPGFAVDGDISFRVLIEAFDLNNALWTPSLTKGSYSGESDQPGVIISENAAIDLGVNVGDMITLEHPRRSGLLSYETVQSEVEVVGLHPDPWRNFVYMDMADAELFGIAGMVNLLHIDPAAEITSSAAKRAMFDFPTVISVITIYDLLDANQSVLNEVTLFLGGVKFGVLALAFLIAFNSTNINMSERSREIATMFAFGLPPRTVTRMAMLENLIVGICGTVIGFGLGALILVWFTQTRMPTILPEIRFPITLSWETTILAILVGVVVVTLTPLLTIRKMMDMDVPDTLRVME
ncbi:MAG: FtsX-like permease family protein [Anaerolineae bacterium]|nr:FtsX-like permease family protein [Anaerolineae bacterium]